ncbi:MAG: hypothetical protein RL322_3237, partial [Pseudomonadota bacterium]
NHFSGNLSDDRAGVGGRLIILNTGPDKSGHVRLSGTNTHSGGTEVRAGATLQIEDSVSLGSGPLDLVGTADLPAVLAITATTTIANPVTVTGDPVFDVAAGTITTITSAISGTGDVEVAGSGTLKLTNANTYSGPTLVHEGATLALSGDVASIAASSAVTNRGVLDLREANRAVISLSGALNQTRTGSLRLVAAAPGVFQRLAVAGAVTLDGELDLTASSGTYAMGRYTLIDATGGRNGTFSSFAHNLTSVTRLGFRLGYDTQQVYLDLTPNADDTLQQIRRNATGLSALMRITTAGLQSGLANDCERFDQRNLCISAGGRHSDTGEGALSNQGGLLVLGYRPVVNARLGVFADRVVSNEVPTGITQTRSDPTLGVFANWAFSRDGAGLNLRASAVFASSELTIRREASPTTEAGRGQSNFDGKAFELRASHVTPVSSRLTAVPYLGLRHTRIANSAYGEAAAADVNWPVRYARLAQEDASALAGLNFVWRSTERLRFTGGAGVQRAFDKRLARYAGSTDLPDLARFDESIGTDRRDLLGNASLGFAYDTARAGSVALAARWQEQSGVSQGARSVWVMWTMGF